MTFETLIANFDKELSKFPILKDLEKKTQVPKTYSTGSFAIFLIFLVVMNVGGRLITNMVGFVYPAYCSFKAIESNNKDDDVQW
jgi:receptor expression-enhancing protein 5/6